MDFISDFLTKSFKSGIDFKNTKEITPTQTFKRLQATDDKSGKKSISYFLNIEYDYAYGYVKNFKTGVDFRYFSHNKDSSPSDLTRIKAMIKKKQAEQDLIIAERQAKIAERANIMWSQSQSIGTTPYLARKGCNLNSARVKDNNLIVPMYEDLDILVSWQTIRPDGTKRFPFGGKKKGCFCIIGDIKDGDKIIIAEGFATAASIFENTNIPTVVAFDAGNLLPVCQKIRKLYPNSPIIIGADNDISGVGEKYAFECKNKVIDVTYVMPKEQGKDFNDAKNEIASAFGVGSITLDNQTMPIELTPPLIQESTDNWRNWLITDKKGGLVSSSLKNAILHLTNHQDFKGVFAYDEFRRESIVIKCPVWEYEDNFKIRVIDDSIITQCTAVLEDYGLSLSVDKVARAIFVACQENKFHPARDYLNNLEWDGVERLGTLFKEYFHSENEDPMYLMLIGKKWFTAMVKRLFQNGCKFDHVVVLESQKQGLFKSTALKVLTTFNGECFCTDSVSVADHSNKDAIKKMQGNIIVELAELTGFSSQDDNAIKNWITQEVDVVRLPYERTVTNFPRQFVFVATTNDFDYLKDPTGNRRYWPITVGGYIDIEGLEEVKEQLWAEAVWLYKRNYNIGVTNGENELCEIERSKRLVSDAWELEVMAAIRSLDLDEFTTEQVMQCMDLKMFEKTDKNKRRVNKILKMNGYENYPTRIGNKVYRAWSKV